MLSFTDIFSICPLLLLIIKPQLFSILLYIQVKNQVFIYFFSEIKKKVELVPHSTYISCIEDGEPMGQANIISTIREVGQIQDSTDDRELASSRMKELGAKLKVAKNE